VVVVRVAVKLEGKKMAKKSKITLGDLRGRPVAVEPGSIILLPVGGSAKETGRTAQPTVIKGDRTQKDRGLEFDYPKPKASARKR